LVESRAHAADCEYAGQTGFERPENVGAGAHKPLSSSITPEPDNQVVFGSAPINKNKWRIARLISSPDRRER
jgi:hypothetical protein